MPQERVAQIVFDCELGDIALCRGLRECVAQFLVYDPFALAGCVSRSFHTERVLDKDAALEVRATVLRARDDRPGADDPAKFLFQGFATVGVMSDNRPYQTALSSWHLEGSSWGTTDGEAVLTPALPCVERGIGRDSSVELGSQHTTGATY
jgi:hypothetical protein